MRRYYFIAIFLLSKKIRKYPQQLPQRKAQLYLGNIIRMQEEIGTGGAGFRFMYAAFLQQAAGVLGESRLQEIAAELTAIGDHWREFARLGARNCKGRGTAESSYPALADILRECADREQRLFGELHRVAG